MSHTLYAPGDVDPTIGIDPTCNAEHEGWLCTWAPDHKHPQHVAGGGRTVFAVWDGERDPRDVALDAIREWATDTAALVPADDDDEVTEAIRTAGAEVLAILATVNR